MAEIMLTLNLLALEILRPRPLCLLGRCWPPVLATMFEQLPSTDVERGLLTLVDTVEEAIQRLAAAAGTPVREGTR